ncbi:glucose-1-phosphate adenylyltransferase [bacterium]|nr:glucose-1-phosphate adenylyltransferase [bacterium]MCI0602166.1 glucose-1-phosphate adenylyltransferase [bacterium]
MYSQNVLTMILAGGEGTRLFPLTRDRAKPAVPFGGRFRIVDFALNNFVNSGFLKIKVLTQFKSDSLNVHLSKAWRLSATLDQYVDAVPAQMRRGEHWYRGTADAVYQNLNLIFDEEPDYVCVFGGDHVYKMDVQQMLDFHKEVNADVTIAAIPVPASESRQFGIIEVDSEWRVIGFEEKPPVGKTIPNNPGYVLASMGNYIFNRQTLISELEEDALLQDSAHDFGKTIFTKIFHHYRVYAYDFSKNVIPGSEEKEVGYWRDVGTIDSYFQANMDLIAVDPVFNLYNYRWPFRTVHYDYPAAKFVFANFAEKRTGIALDSMVSEGCIVSGGVVNRSILSPRAMVHSYTKVDDSILMHSVDIGRYAKVKNAIIDKGVKIPRGCEVGYDRNADLQRGFHVSEGGVVVVPKGTVLD